MIFIFLFNNYYHYRITKTTYGMLLTLMLLLKRVPIGGCSIVSLTLEDDY